MKFLIVIEIQLYCRNVSGVHSFLSFTVKDSLPPASSAPGKEKITQVLLLPCLSSVKKGSCWSI